MQFAMPGLEPGIGFFDNSRMIQAAIKHIRTPTLDIAYEEHGPAAGAPVILLHGWPYDPRDYDKVVPSLAAAGCRAVVPYLRGYGPTRFLSERTPRSGQQAALGNDLKGFMDALGIARATLAGYDWGGRAACIVAALWPERVRALVSGNAYNIQDIAGSVAPDTPDQEHRFWYQYYFHTERGRAGLETNRRELCKFIWKLWSPNWQFDDATFEASAASFDNPDFVAVTIQSYRHRFGYADGDPALEPIEQKLAMRPTISVPAIALQGEADGVGTPARSEKHARFFTGPYERRVLPRVGHNPPQEAPQAVVDAVLDLMRATSS
jgi:pimeloyl-ACP methyl ester carboxylesterase